MIPLGSCSLVVLHRLLLHIRRYAMFRNWCQCVDLKFRWLRASPKLKKAHKYPKPVSSEAMEGMQTHARRPLMSVKYKLNWHSTYFGKGN